MPPLPPPPAAHAVIAAARADSDDAGARALLARARAARLTQDAALASYDAHTYQRFSVGLGLSAFSRERLLLRTEAAAHVTWSRAAGVTIEQTGSRAVLPGAKEAGTSADLVDATPIPYFPGRETLWFPSPSFGIAKPDVDPKSFIHPLANGAEAYYRYALGDAAGIRLPDGRSIGLRELRVTPRRASPRTFIGSFWFDTASGHVVRAVYRMSVEFDLWKAADENVRRQLDSLRQVAARDTARAGAADRRRERDRAERNIQEERPPGWFAFATGPVRATISAVTVEYGLFEGRVWLPRRSVAEGQATSGLFRMPITLDERYRYDAVNVVGAGAAVATAMPTAPAATGGPGTPAAPSLPGVAPAGVLRTAVDSALALTPADSAGRGEMTMSASVGDDGRGRTSVDLGAAGRRARVDSLLRSYARAGEALTRRSDSLAAAGDTAGARRARADRDRARRRAGALARREVQCAAGATYYDAGTRRHTDSAGPVVHVRRPCDPATLASSPDLPKSPYDDNDAPLAAADRAALLATLDKVVPGNWPAHAPQLRTGLDLVRFNRVEGLSLGVGATATLPSGLAADGTLRLGVADLVPNAELGVTRARGASAASTLRLAAYHRLAVANDDWGNPLGFGASLAAALYGRDEGFYYRGWGAELRGARAADALVDPDGTPGGGPLALFRGAAVGWRVFAEEQRGAGREVGKGLIGPRYVPNIAADRAGVLGAGGELARTFGADPAGVRVVARARGEGAVARYASPNATAGAAAGPLGAPPGGPRTAPYARALGDLTVSRPLGPLAVGLTGAAGALAGGRVPVQRLFYLGGLQTVRGNFPRASGDGYVGRQFWLARAEVGLAGRTLLTPVVFFDAGRAGERAFARGETLRGVGAGVTVFDGLLRVEGARGLGAQTGGRVDVSLGGRF